MDGVTAREGARARSGHRACGLLAVVLLVGGCSGDDDGTAMVPSGPQSFPSQTLTDWVSYADQISVVRVVDEQVLPTGDDSAADSDAGRYIGRRATFAVESTLWHDDQVPVRSRVTMTTSGWVEKDGARVPAAPESAYRFEVGQRFVLPISRDGDGEATILAPGAAVPLFVETGPAHDAAGPAVRQLRGRSESQMRATLARAIRDPLATRYHHLPPWQRSQQVLDQRDRSSTL